MIRRELCGIVVFCAALAATTGCGLATDGEAMPAASSSLSIATDATVQRVYFNTTNHITVGAHAAAAEIDLMGGSDVAIETTSADSSPLVFELLRIRNDGTTELISPVHAESGFHLDTLSASSDDAYAVYFPNVAAKAQAIEIRLTCNSPASACTRAGQPGDRCTEVFVCDEGLACSAAAEGAANAYLAGGVCLTPNGEAVE